MDHLMSKLGAAGMVDKVITTTASAQATMHTEKVSHITSKLSGAGLDTGTGTTAEVKDSNTGSTTQGSATNADKAFLHHNQAGTYAIIGIVAGLLLLTIVAGILFAFKRRQRRYASVGGKQKGMTVEKDVFNAEIQEPETEGLQQQEAGLRERNFESGYDNFDSQYDGSDYVVNPIRGDKRAQYEA